MNHILRYIILISLLFGTSCTSYQQKEFLKKSKYLIKSRNVGTISKQKLHWESIYYDDFNDPKNLKQYPIVNGDWKILNGQLQAIMGKTNRTILLHKCIQGAMKIEFQVKNIANSDGSIGDITVLLNSEKSKSFFKKGYALTTGSYYNNCTTFYKYGKAIAKTEYSPLQSEKTYLVTLEWNDGHIRYWLDDTILLETWDPTPIPLDNPQWIGIRTWNTNMLIDWVRISKGIKSKSQ